MTCTEQLLITVEQAARCLGISRATFYERIYNRGLINPVRIGRSVRFRADDVAQLVERLANEEVFA
jgi:excisionase family DNA binding protein